MCAALELGRDWMPSRRDWGELWSEGAPLACDVTSERRLYSVTSGGAGKLPGPGAGYSLPSYVCSAAFALGLTGVVFVANTVLGATLELVLRGERSRATALGIEFHETAPPRPAEGERLLRVIRTGPDLRFVPAVAFHWVLERPGGSIMDPAGIEFGHGPGTAWTVESLDLLTAGRKAQGLSYIDTGIGIVLRPQGAVPPDGTEAAI